MSCPQRRHGHESGRPERNATLSSTTSKGTTAQCFQLLSALLQALACRLSVSGKNRVAKAAAGSTMRKSLSVASSQQ